MWLMEVDPDVARPGWVPLVILVVMAVVLFFLFRSMRKMVKTLDPDLPHKRDLGPDGTVRPGDAGDRDDRPAAHAAATEGPDRPVDRDRTTS